MSINKNAMVLRLRRWFKMDPQPERPTYPEASRFLDEVGRCADAAIAQRAKPCPDCAGTGADDPGNVDTVPCGVCGGSGRVAIEPRRRA